MLQKQITLGCISFVSYIKPQPIAKKLGLKFVVYLLYPTSNHNEVVIITMDFLLYIFCILHQTTTYRFKSTDFQCLTITFSNKKWRVGLIS